MLKSLLLFSACSLFLLSCSSADDGAADTDDTVATASTGGGSNIVDTSAIVGLGDGSGASAIMQDATYMLTLENLHDTFGSESLMITKFGTDNVAQEEFHLGEGETMPGTVLYPDDPSRRVEVLWLFPEKRESPNIVRIAGDGSQWTLAPGLTPGISLGELEELNGGPFTLLGFEWDNAGGVTDWKGGKIGAMESEEVSISVHFYPSQMDYERMGAKMEPLLGDREISSDDPAMRELSPRVGKVEIYWAM